MPYHRFAWELMVILLIGRLIGACHENAVGEYHSWSGERSCLPSNPCVTMILSACPSGKLMSGWAQPLLDGPCGGRHSTTIILGRSEEDVIQSGVNGMDSTYLLPEKEI